jgi:hypothetical protein
VENEEAPHALRKAIELVRAEARRSRLVEVVAPGELREQAPEDAEGLIGIDIHMSIPHVLASTDAVADKTQRFWRELYAGVKKQSELPPGGLETRTSRFEPTFPCPTYDP